MQFDQIKYQNKYNKEHYARVNVCIPIEDREKVYEHWKKKGYKSFNAYINDLIRKDMNNEPGNINVGDINQQGSNNSINIG